MCETQSQKKKKSCNEFWIRIRAEFSTNFKMLVNVLLPFQMCVCVYVCVCILTYAMAFSWRSENFWVFCFHLVWYGVSWCFLSAVYPRLTGHLALRNSFVSWRWWYTPFIPALGRQRWEDLYELTASPVYKLSSRAARTDDIVTKPSHTSSELWIVKGLFI